MEFRVHITTTYECSLERAFKTPILCDVTRIHTGLGLMPRVTHCTGDENWGRPGASKNVFVARSLTHAGGFASIDRVLERIENRYWKIEVTDFQAWMLGFYRFVGEWKTTQLDAANIQIDYTYTLYSNQVWLYPFNWLFANLFWRSYMKQVLNNIRALVRNQEPYQYA